MPFVIKTGVFDAQLGAIITLSETPMYDGKLIRNGDRVYIWCCKTDGGEELSWRGSVISEPVVGRERKLDLTAQLENQAPVGCLKVSHLNQYRDVKDGSAISGLAEKLYGQSHKKVAKLTQNEADFLDTYFLAAR